jgi:ATP-dependent DNA helicase RecG
MYVKEKGKITNREYQGIGKTSKPTATRELTALVVLNLLEKQGVTGKGTYYSLLKGSKGSQRGHKGLKGVTNGSSTKKKTIR